MEPIEQMCRNERNSVELLLNTNIAWLFRAEQSLKLTRATAKIVRLAWKRNVNSMYVCGVGDMIYDQFILKQYQLELASYPIYIRWKAPFYASNINVISLIPVCSSPHEDKFIHQQFNQNWDCSALPSFIPPLATRASMLPRHFINSFSRIF